MPGAPEAAAGRSKTEPKPLGSVRVVGVSDPPLPPTPRPSHDRLYLTAHGQEGVEQHDSREQHGSHQAGVLSDDRPEGEHQASARQGQGQHPKEPLQPWDRDEPQDLGATWAAGYQAFRMAPVAPPPGPHLPRWG